MNRSSTRVCAFLRTLRIASPWMVMCAVASVATAETFAMPDLIRWGATTAELERALAGKCANGLNTRPIEPPFLPVVESKQVQIDCDGFEFMGAPRWVEFVIGDDRLQMVWLMVEDEDQEKIVEAMTAAYGEPSSENAKYIAYAQKRAAWRFVPAEVLFYAEELDSWILPSFEPDE